MLLKHALESAAELQSLRLVVDTVTTAEVMVELYRKRNWDYKVCIVDEMLSDAGGVMRGSEGVAQLRALGCQTKFVFSSAFCSSEDRERYLQAGAELVW